MFARLRAVITPRIALLFIVLMLILMQMRCPQRDIETALERRTSKALSSMTGAGKVTVVISTRTVSDKSTLQGMRSATDEQVPCGVIAVAQGADDPFVRAQLTDALSALLGLPVSSVSVISGGK